MGKIKVIVVDDSALIRSLMTRIIDAQPDMQVVATANDPYEAREKIHAAMPDVMTLDIEMPRMNGLDFLERLMRAHPMPVIMVSSLTERGAESTMRALELGAVDFVTKPKAGVNGGMLDYAEHMADKIRAAYQARTRFVRRPEPNRVVAPAEAGGVLPNVGNAAASRESLIAIGASTGGTEAIKDVLMRLPTDSPPILVTQHMPVGFTKSFAQRLDNLCKIAVKEAEDGEVIRPGHAYIAPGGLHLLLRRRGREYLTGLSDAPPVNRHRPSVEALFRSVAENAQGPVVGIMLTGMGKDGAEAMLAMRQAGAHNLAQDEASCVVFGMPREAIAVGAVHETLPLQEIAAHVLHHLRRGLAKPVRG
ncbi:MAG: chemotaxis response regulator protein-glutamate methylesterase [Burkholderiaceae bacterium]|nr:MAG: chemotaxis response regulator protein-glutamate methylesterase [Burkholderiaceae bacterium]